MNSKQNIVLPSRKCIYCLVEKKSNEFNKEHVVPRLMGGYEGGLTIKSMCRDCNSYFGVHVDPVLAEDSFEALLRFASGLVKPTAVEVMKWQRLTITVPGDGWWSGTRARLVCRDSELYAVPIAQVGLLRKSTGVLDYYTLPEIQEIQDWNDISSQDFKVISSTEEEEKALMTLCHEKFGAGVSFKQPSVPPPSNGTKMDFDISSRIDDLIKRAVCKISINYLAKMISADKRESLFDNSFEDIREFARSGTKLPANRISVATGNTHSILQLPQNQGIYAHLIVLQYDRQGSLHCRFSPFDHFHYDIVLAENHPRIIEPVGHAFFYKTDPKRCELLGTRSGV